MAIVTIFSGTFCYGEEVADRVTERLGYDRIDRVLLDRTAARLATTPSKLLRAMQGPPLFNSITHARERSISGLRLVLGELAESNNVVCHGMAGHLFGKSISHVLRVCLIAKLGHRIDVARMQGLATDEARRLISREDDVRIRWTRHVFGSDADAYDPDLYDVVLPMDSNTVDEASDMICRYARQPALRTTEDSERAMRDFILASKVGLHLAENGHDVGVVATDGHVCVTINRYVVRLSHYKKKLEELAGEVSGVRGVTVTPGTRFVPPSLTRNIDLEVPSKVLLVDDEREFVQTLSERLQSRNLDSAVVYDGEEALSLLATDEPEVMVLDLRMPGIDGMEVLRRVKRDHPRVEVIILTGHGTEREEKVARELGAFAYLHKPVDLDQLARVMREAYRKTKQSP